MKEAEWLESEVRITISLQMRGASLATVDLVQTDTYIKVGHGSEDFICEVQLRERPCTSLLDSKCCKVSNI